MKNERINFIKVMMNLIFPPFLFYLPILIYEIEIGNFNFARFIVMILGYWVCLQIFKETN